MLSLFYPFCPGLGRTYFNELIEEEKNNTKKYSKINLTLMS